MTGLGSLYIHTGVTVDPTPSRCGLVCIPRSEVRPHVTFTHRPPTLHKLLRTISLLYSRWSTSGSDRGIAQFFTATRNTIEGAGEQNEQNEQNAWVNSSAEGKLCNTAFPVYICRLTLAWILAKILQRY